MTVARQVGAALVAAGIDQVFGVIGSGNFVVTNAMVAAGARFVAARHEGGAATMADAYARTTGQPAALSVHQGCGLTNALTGIAEAAKSRTPLVVITAETMESTSNFYVDQASLAEAVGAISMRVDSPETAEATAHEAVRRSREGRQTVVLNLPLAVLKQPAVAPCSRVGTMPSPVTSADPTAVNTVVDALRDAERPVLLAGRGARGCGPVIREIGERSGALLATSAVAKGLFSGDPWDLDIAGGFATPAAETLLGEADLVIALGCGLRSWTTRGQTLFENARVLHVDDDAGVHGRYFDGAEALVGDVPALLEAVRAGLAEPRTGFRTPEAREVIDRSGRRQDVAYDDLSTDGEIDPRSLTIELDRMLPAERVVAVDSGNFMGYPSMFFDVPDERGFCFTQAFQSIGLGLATAVGAALAQPDRLPVAALGDGGALMGAAELDTVARLGLGMLIVVYNDSAYGAEIHHFGPAGEPLDLVEFPETDIAAIARGYGLDGVTVRSVGDLGPVRDWIAGPRSTSLLIDAKIARDGGAWWLEHAFRGH